ncbi:MAG: hypothetical protein AMXMBFR53_28260 [Gemmatimonadota bacterium]
MRRLAPSLLLVVLVAAAPAAAQVLPGTTARERGSIRAEFLDAVMHGVRETSTRWMDALHGGDADAAAALYLDDALLVPPSGREVIGADAIRRYMAEAVESLGGLETFLSDVDASNNMAMTAERFVLPPASPGDDVMRGTLLTVWLNDGRRWRIRAQVFRPREDETGGP